MADIFTQAGEELVADIITNPASHPGAGGWFVHWGTGAGTAAKGSTALNTPAAESRVATTDSQPSADVNQFLGTITSLSNQTITNAGIFNASSGGTLLLHSDFAGIALNTNDSIQFTFQLTWS